MNYMGSSEEAMDIVRAIGLRDKRIRDLEEQVEFLTKTLEIIRAEAEEDEANE